MTFFFLFTRYIYVYFSDVHNASSKQRWKNPIKKSPIINWAMHKKTQGSTKSNSIDVQSPGKYVNLTTVLSQTVFLFPFRFISYLVMAVKCSGGNKCLRCASEQQKIMAYKYFSRKQSERFVVFSNIFYIARLSQVDTRNKNNETRIGALHFVNLKPFFLRPQSLG